jgi:hypothetical protein
MCGGAAGTLPIYATAFNTVSAQRFKYGFAPIQHGLAEVMALEPLTYHYNFEKEEGTKRHMGMIAEDVLRIVPEAVAEEDGQCIGLDYSSLVPVLIKAVQEQQAMITAQNVKIAELEKALLTK